MHAAIGHSYAIVVVTGKFLKRLMDSRGLISWVILLAWYHG